MKRFFIGLHHPSDAWPFLNSMISINQLEGRISPFRVNNWLLDSGAFTQISRHGRWTTEPERYADQVNRWARVGTMLGAVTQDMMCEPFILNKTGLSTQQHQEITITRYLAIVSATDSYIMPVIQGYTPEDYMRHTDMYGAILGFGQWVGVGSVCRRNSHPSWIFDILSAIKSRRPDLKLHGFGLKITALRHDGVLDLLDSSDSMAWCKHGQYSESGDSNDPRVALRYAAHIEDLLRRPLFIQPHLAQWWLN